MDNPEREPKREDWCSRSRDVDGYTSNHATGICMDATGKGNKRDYCRMVSWGEDTFLACDLGSRGGYSYWFRSITSQDGLPSLEVPYSKSFGGSRVDSYCGVVPPTSLEPATAKCITVKGAGFGSVPKTDPDPPDAARTRLITYESMVNWFPLVYPADTKSVGAFPGRIGDLAIRAVPETTLPESYPDRRGVRIWRGSPRLMPAGGSLPINESACISLMVKPSSQDDATSEQIILYAADGPYINECSIVYNPTSETMGLRIYDGKSLTMRIQADGIKKDTWNHVLFQYRNGFWESWTMTRLSHKKAGSRHPFTRRGQQMIGHSPSGHTASHFSGSIADLRFYRNPIPKIQIQGIHDDFMILQARPTL